MNLAVSIELRLSGLTVNINDANNLDRSFVCSLLQLQNYNKNLEHYTQDKTQCNLI